MLLLVIFLGLIVVPGSEIEELGARRNRDQRQLFTWRWLPGC